MSSYEKSSHNLILEVQIIWKTSAFVVLMEVLKCLKIVEFSKISIKIKIFKYFMRLIQRAAFRKLFGPLPHKSFLRHWKWNKNFLTKIYRIMNYDIMTLAFQVLRECSSWPSKNVAVQRFFMTPARNMFAGKLVKWVKFFAVLREFIFYNFEWVEVHKMSEVFWAKIFLYFLLDLRLSATISKIKR